MRVLPACLLLSAAVTMTAMAQTGSLLDQRPFKNDSFTAPPPAIPPSGEETTPPNDITASPLPPPPPADEQDMVPNPLGAPADKAPAGKQAGQEGQPQKGSWVQMASATLQALDKVNARTETLVVKVGDVGHFGSLDIGVRGCFVRAPDRPADATAFVVVADRHAEGQVFSGWMVRSAPFMSMMAHPIYDIRVAGCTP